MFIVKGNIVKNRLIAETILSNILRYEIIAAKDGIHNFYKLRLEKIFKQEKKTKNKQKTFCLTKKTKIVLPFQPFLKSKKKKARVREEWLNA